LKFVSNFQSICRRFASHIRFREGHSATDTDSLGDISHDVAETIDALAHTNVTVPAPPKIDGYEILGEISRGGMGVVYRARQLSANRLVAIKMIISGAAAGKKQIARFFVEAKAAANLDHPGIVPIFDVGTQDGLPFYSMALIEGQSLKDFLDDGVLPSQSAARLLLDIAKAMDYAHSRGIVHRDLKPANVLIKQRTSGSRGSGNAISDSGSRTSSGTFQSSDATKNWIPVVTDFGLAKQMEEDSSLTGTDQMLGTPSYMAPEQPAAHR
jgi:serine/threonine protein kinase